MSEIKYCKNCKHCVPDWSMAIISCGLVSRYEYAKCGIATYQDTKNLVYGTKPKFGYCSVERSYGVCGPDANNYEPRK